ncbi:MAG: hypothetical protein NVS2B3_10320 [Vulcanimicrobiaceae bacterium]
MVQRHVDPEHHLTSVRQYIHSAEVHEEIARRQREVARQLEAGDAIRAGFHTHAVRGHHVEITLHAEASAEAP